MDVATVKGDLVTRKTQIQVAAIPDLPMDLGRVITPEGKQLQTVGHHWPGSRPLNKKQRDNMERIGVCLSCHQDIPHGTPAIKRLNQRLKQTGRTPSTDEAHTSLLQEITRNALDIFDRAHVMPPRHGKFSLEHETETPGQQ